MSKKKLIILCLTFISGFNLSAYAYDRPCYAEWRSSSAWKSCNLINDTPKKAEGNGCNLEARCQVNNSTSYGAMRYTQAQPKLYDVKRLVNCNGSLEYDYCR